MACLIDKSFTNTGGSHNFRSSSIQTAEELAVILKLNELFPVCEIFLNCAPE